MAMEHVGIRKLAWKKTSVVEFEEHGSDIPCDRKFPVAAEEAEAIFSSSQFWMPRGSEVQRHEEEVEEVAAEGVAQN